MDLRFRTFCVALGQHVRALRQERGLTQEDMMDHGFSVRHYQRIEAGLSINLLTVWNLARAFGVPPRSILPDGTSPSRSLRRPPDRQAKPARGNERRRSARTSRTL
jgi:transcriptional regulator with XRE-family HTH domain